MNEISVFENRKFGSVRIIDRDGEPWFVGNDVAAALGYDRPRDAVRKFCKGGVKMTLPSASGEQDTTIIPESDMFRLIMRSKRPDAEAFQDWVVEEVLPAIRRRGEYAPAARREVTVGADELIALADRLRLAEDRVDAMRPRRPYGTISETNGRERTQLIRAYFRTLQRDLLREIDAGQMRLFDF